MKKTVRILTLVLAIVMSVSVFVGCGSNNVDNDSGHGDDDAPEETTKANEVKIEDIDWSIKSGIVEDRRYALFSYTNKSDFVIREIEISFKEKSGITETQKEQYYKDIFELLNLDENNPEDEEDIQSIKNKEISMCAESEKICHPKENVTNERVRYYNGYYYVTYPEHYDFVEPDFAKIKFVAENKIFTEYYDFRSKEYTLDDETEVAFYWTEKAIGNELPKPEAEFVELDYYDEEEKFSFEVYGWTAEDYNKYVKQCKEYGFTLNANEGDDDYTADSSKGYHIELDFYARKGKLNAEISKKD